MLFAVSMIGVNIFLLNLLINLSLLRGGVVSAWFLLPPPLTSAPPVDDIMQRINDDEGDAFPFERARIICGEQGLPLNWVLRFECRSIVPLNINNRFGTVAAAEGAGQHGLLSALAARADAQRWRVRRAG